QAAKAQIADLQAEVKRLQKELRSLRESESVQQHKLAIEVELNKRMRLLQKLRDGTNHVEGMLARAQDVSEAGDMYMLHQKVDAGAKELEALVQALEAEFGMPGKAPPRSRQPARHGSSTGRRLTLDSEDLSSLLTSSSNRVHEMASKRISLKEASAQRARAAGHLITPAARSAGQEGSTRPANSHTVDVQSNEQPQTEDGQDPVMQVDLRSSAPSSIGGLSSQQPASSLRAEDDTWGGGQDGQASVQEDETAGSQPTTRYSPPSSQLPGPRSQGVGVSTVVGRQGPPVFGMRPPRNQMGSIEDATRWGGMFERLHASYLDPNGVWRVYTQRDGPSGPVDTLQPLLEGAHNAAQRADISAKAAASAMAPMGHVIGAMGANTQSGGVSGGAGMSSSSSSRGRALAPTRRPQSAMPASSGLYAIQQQQQQQQQQQHDLKGFASCSASRSPSPPTQQDVRTAWPHQVGSQGMGPPLLKHNVYQQQLDQPAGSFNVRMLTATPQKGIMLRSRPRSAHPDSTGRWDLGPGEGE
ncbi:hypothetical protein DUNSADRAFT_11582, partial [Dunaliella salina]